MKARLALCHAFGVPGKFRSSGRVPIRSRVVDGMPQNCWMRCAPKYCRSHGLMHDDQAKEPQTASSI